MLEHDTRPARPVVSRRRVVRPRTSEKRVPCGSATSSASPPADAVSSGAIRDETRSSTRVPRLSFASLCACAVGQPPVVGAGFSRRIISLLNFVSFPYERLHHARSLSFFRYSLLLRFTPRGSLQSTTPPLCDYSRYTSLTQLCRGPYDVSLTLPTPRGTRHYQRNERCHARNFSKFNKLLLDGRERVWAARYARALFRTLINFSQCTRRE